MTTFDPNAFLEQQQQVELDDKYTPVPEGVYQGMIVNNPDNENQQIKVRDIVPTKGKRAGETIYVLDVPIRLDAPGNEEADGKVIRYSAFLDINEAGSLETGPNKNVQLGALRSAVGQNSAEKPWKPMDLEGQLLQVKVEHDEDGKYSNVTEVAPAQ